MRHGYTTQNEKAMVFIKLWHYIFRPEKTQGFPPFSDPKIGKTLSSPPKIGEDGLSAPCRTPCGTASGTSETVLVARSFP